LQSRQEQVQLLKGDILEAAAVLKASIYVTALQHGSSNKPFNANKDISCKQGYQCQADASPTGFDGEVVIVGYQAKN
jgi:hypothetical protein